jgi:hypothetical protein
MKKNSMKENYSSLEGREINEKGPNKRKWETARNWILGLSMLINGGFIAENAKTQFDLKSIEDGQSQSFSIEKSDDNSDAIQADGKHYSGERGNFNLVRQSDGTWRLEGEIDRYFDVEHNLGDSTPETVTPISKLDYELPALSPDVVQALFDDLKSATSTLNEKATRQVSPEEYLRRLIGLARKGTLTEYSAEYAPERNGIYRTLELDASGEKGPMITATYKDVGPDGADQAQELSLDDVRAGALNKY